jgi:hypothetical protein
MLFRVRLRAFFALAHPSWHLLPVILILYGSGGGGVVAPPGINLQQHKYDHPPLSNTKVCNPKASRNPKMHYGVHTHLPPDRVSFNMKSVCTVSLFLRLILILSFHSPLCLTHRFLSLVSVHILYAACHTYFFSV